MSAQSVYYVAPTGSDTTGTGSATAPWATPAKAALAVPDNGSTVIVRNGTYTGSVYVPRKFTHLTTFRAENAYQARLRSAVDMTVHIRNAANVEFSGFDIAKSDPNVTGPLAVKIAASENVILRNNIIHESYNNDLLKINESSRNILITGNVFRNQQGTAGQHIDVNGCIDVTIRENMFFNDAAAAGISAARIGESHGFIVVKNSSWLPESRRTRIIGNVFLNFQGSVGSNYVLLGEDGYNIFETQEVDVANNLMLGNFTSRMKAPLGLKGVRMVQFRNNTVTGDVPADAFAVRINKEGTNLRTQDVTLSGNIWSDPSGTMTDFADGSPAESVDINLDNNVYWNNGNPIPSDTDVLNAFQDVRGLTADPRLPSLAGMVLPNWQGTRFASGSTSIRAEFIRLVQTYGRPQAGSPVIGRSDPAMSPEVDILDSPRGSDPDVGAVEAGASLPQVRVLLFTPRVMGGLTTTLNRIALPSLAGGTVLLTSSNPGLASVPSSVTVPAGDDSVTFPVTTFRTGTAQPVTITATFSGSTHRASLTVVPQAIVSVNTSYTYPKAGTTSTHYVLLEGPAVDPFSITMSSDQAGMVSFPSAPATAPDRSYASFSVACKLDSGDWTKTNMTATASNSSATTYISFEPTVAGVASLSLSNSAPVGPATVTATLRLSKAAQSDVSVALSASPADAVTLPSSLAIRTAQESGTFSITVPKVTTAKEITITATLAGANETAVMTIGTGTGPVLSDVSVSSSAVTGPATVPATITLSAPAPAGGAAVTLSATPSTVLTVPTSVTVPAGSTSVGFNVAVKGVTTVTPGSISATWASVTKTDAISVQPPSSVSLSAVTLSTASIVGPATFTGTVTLSGPAPDGGATVTLVGAPSTALAAPAAVTVAEGATSANFTASAKEVAADTPAAITAAYGGVSKAASISVRKPSPATIELTGIVVPANTFGGLSIQVTAILADAAPAGGATVRLSSSSTDVIAPAAVAIPAGASRASVMIPVAAVTADKTVTISMASGGVTRTAGILVKAPVLTKIYMPTEIMGADNATLGVYLSSPAPAGFTLDISAGRGELLRIPVSLQFPAGASRMALSLPSMAVPVSVTFPVTFRAGSSSIVQSLTLNPVTPMTIYPGLTTVTGGVSVQGTVVMFSAPAAAGTRVVITSSNPSVVSVPGVVLAPAADRIAFNMQTSAVSSTTPVTITVSSGEVTRTFNITVTP